MSMTQEQQWQRQQQSRRSRANKPALNIDVMVPDEQLAQQINQQFVQEPSSLEVSYRRENDGTPHVRIAFPASAVTQFKQHLQRLTDQVERAYQSTGYAQQQ